MHVTLYMYIVHVPVGTIFRTHIQQCTLHPTAADGVQQCRNAMKGDLEASQEKEERRDSSLDPAHLNLLYCYSVSCPLLVEDEDSGMPPSTLLYIHV